MNVTAYISKVLAGVSHPVYALSRPVGYGDKAGQVCQYVDVSTRDTASVPTCTTIEPRLSFSLYLVEENRFLGRHFGQIPRMPKAQKHRFPVKVPRPRSHTSSECDPPPSDTVGSKLCDWTIGIGTWQGSEGFPAFKFRQPLHQRVSPPGFRLLFVL